MTSLSSEETVSTQDFPVPDTEDQAHEPQVQPVPMLEPFWLKSSCTGQELLENRLPRVANDAVFLRVAALGSSMDEMTSALLSSCAQIPSSSELGKVVQALTKEKGESCPNQQYACFKNTSTYFSAEMVRMCLRTHEILQIRVDLPRMLSWLDRVTTSASLSFINGLRAILLRAPDISRTVMPTRRGTLHIRSLLRFADELWLDDDIIDLALQEMGEMDTGRNKFVLIPAQHLSVANSSDLSQSCWQHLKSKVEQLVELGEVSRLHKQDAQAKAVGAILTGGNHWGILCFDFVTMAVSFGHSLDRGRAHMEDSVRGLVDRWLDYHGVSMKIGFSNLTVPYQGAGSGSCAVVALNTIERMMDPSVEVWAAQKSEHHRLRLLRMIVDTSLQEMAEPLAVGFITDNNSDLDIDVAVEVLASAVSHVCLSVTDESHEVEAEVEGLANKDLDQLEKQMRSSLESADALGDVSVNSIQDTLRDIVPFDQQILPWAEGHQFGTSSRLEVEQLVKNWSLNNGFDIKVLKSQKQSASVKGIFF